MSLDNIQLPPFIIQDLFQNSLVELENSPQKPNNDQRTSSKHFGGNKQHILILVNDKSSAYLDEAQLTFLSGILSACKLTLEDVALVNIGNTTADYKKLTESLSPKIVLMFGVTPDEIDLPFLMPEFQRQSYNNQVYIASPSLSELEKNKELKRKLWTVLQQLFAI